MSNQHKLSLAVLASGTLAALPQVEAGEGLVEGASATLQARNYYFSRDYSDIVGANPQSKTEEWAQGFILDFRSGYTPGPVGFGLDAIGLLGLKLDSSPERTNSGLLPVDGDGRAPDDYSRLGVALKAKVSRSELKLGELQPNLPVLPASDNRLLPPTYQGAMLASAEIPGLALQAGRLKSYSVRNEAGTSDLQAMVGATPYRQVESDAFNFAGGDYDFNAKRTRASLWYGQLEDIYRQGFLGLRHSQPAGDWVLGGNLGFYDAKEDGKRLLGNLDNRAFYALLSARRGGHTFYVGYQGMFGDDGFPRVFPNVAPLGNEVPTFQFASADERSWQVRHDYDFAALGIPGLSTTLRYLRGSNVDTGRGFEGRDRERDLELAYTLQGGPLAGLNIRLRNAMARSNYLTDIDENRLILSYTWKLF
ncbi:MULTISPECIES: OprD family porin [Pseudomonas]|uniref:OprD family porin n=1 Tax=Pseudomonas TaxID=286 RepID=UPI002E275A57|nr:OprD family porin [Pseudomonas sp. JH-2]